MNFNRLVNRTLMTTHAEALEDIAGRRVLTVIAKMTWSVGATGEASIAAPAQPVRQRDVTRSAGGESSLVRPSDLCAAKPGTDVIRRAATRWPDCDILVITIFGDEAHVLSAIDAGAGGYLLKDGSLASVRDHLACLRSGGSPLSPTIARTLIRRTRALQDPTGNPATGPGVAPAVGPQTGTPAGTQRSDDLQGGSSPLSERELQVLIGVSKGFSYLEVAGSLGVSTNTIRTHVRRIYEKLAVNSRAEALYEYNRRRAEQGQPPLR